MSYLTELQNIVSRFQANSTVPSVAYDDFNSGKFDTPTISTSDFAAGIWARPTVAPVPRAVAPLAGVTRPGPVGLGADAKTYREGLIVVQHFAPRGSALLDLLGKVDETRSIFDRARFGNIVCRDTDAPEIVGPDESGEWFQVNTTTPYYVLEATP